MSALLVENKLHDFFRVSWVSEEAKQVWWPRLVRLKQAIHSCRPRWVEQQIVGYYIYVCLHDEIEAYLSRLQPMGLTLLTYHYRHRHLDLIPRFGVKMHAAARLCIICRQEDRHRLEQLVLSRDRRALLTAGGMTDSEAAVFIEFIHAGYQDPLLWSCYQQPDFLSLYNHGLRWQLLQTMGMVNGLPIFLCHDTEERWHHILGLLTRHHPEPAAWLKAMLDWPMHWSALHGIAEVKAPVAKFIYRTDATAKKIVLALEGTTYPEEGAVGLMFPYNTSLNKQLF